MLRSSRAGLPPGALEGAGLPPGMLGDSESVSAGGYSGVSNFSDGVLNTDTASEAPVSASFQPETPSHRSETGVDVTHQTPPPSASTIMGEGLSLDSYDTAKQLFDRYGAEEGLRRLQEMDPDAAERFERERRPSRDAPKDDAYSDNQPPDDSP